ncbi:MAG: NTP transferase domain-containing protein [Pseudolabrys sp.]|nr:NTP transferase domain-containing protein [Pseudolabrys sp.]
MSEESFKPRVIILAGGKGARLRPYTATFPKPLVPLGDVPIVEILVRRLVSFGLTDITFTLGHLAELIKAYFDHRVDLTSRLNLTFLTEDAPTGTAGSLAFVPNLTDTFLAMNGDILTDLNFAELIAFHRANRPALTIATCRRTTQIDLGVLEVDGSGHVINYREKPSYDYDVSMGIYVYEPHTLDLIEKGTHVDFPELVLRLISAGEKVCAWNHGGLWLDIGRPDDYAAAQDLFEKNRQLFIG